MSLHLLQVRNIKSGLLIDQSLFMVDKKGRKRHLCGRCENFLGVIEIKEGIPQNFVVDSDHEIQVVEYPYSLDILGVEAEEDLLFSRWARWKYENTPEEDAPFSVIRFVDIRSFIYKLKARYIAANKKLYDLTLPAGYAGFEAFLLGLTKDQKADVIVMREEPDEVNIIIEI